VRAAAAVAAGYAAWLSFKALQTFLDRVVLDSRIDVTRIDWTLPRLALQGGLFMLVAAAGSVVAALLGLALRRDGVREAGRPPRPGIPTALRATLATLALTAVYVPLLQDSYVRLRRDFFEFDLRPRVLNQKEGRLAILRNSLSSVAEPTFAATAGFEEAGGSRGLAYQLWGRTPLAASGLASSLTVFDEEGRTVSRFAVNLGEMFEARFVQARDAAGGAPQFIPPREGVTIKKAVLFGSRWVTTPGSASRLVVMTVIDDYDNVPLLGAESAYLPLLRARALSSTNPELLRFEPLVAVFGRKLERLYESGGEIPVPSDATVAAIQHAPYVWTSDVVGEGPAQILYFRGEWETFAIAYVRRDLMGSVATWLRISLLNGAVLLGAALLARSLRALAGHPAAPLAAGGTIYARLTAVFLLTALAPLLSLALFVTRFSAKESERNLVASGLASLQTVRGAAEDYMNQPNPGYGAELGNEAIFWLSRVVRQDINLYRGADLVATSTPELYDSYLLNRRLEASVYRALYLDGEPFRLARVPLADLDYRTLSSPMRLDLAGTLGVVTIPLAAQGRVVARRADQLADAILISSCLTIALLVLVGWLVARQVSTPIALLAGASRRVAGGDLDVRVRSRAGGEMGILVDSFNRMAESLSQQRHDLRRRSEYIETILATATTGVMSLDARGTLITINPAAQQLLTGDGRTPQPGDDLSERLEGQETLAPLGEALERSLAGTLEGEVALALGPGEKDRRWRAVFLRFKHGEDALPGRIVILEDVTDIVKSGRLAAWAEAARRVAHEVKNPLTPIQLSVEHVRRLWRAGDARFGTVLQECLDNIQGQVKALRQIATEFSAYARLPRLRPEPTRIEDLLSEVLRPYAAAPPQGVELTSIFEPGLPDLRVDRAVIMRVLVNLVENALQAMPAGGRLEIAARRAPRGAASHPGRRAAGDTVRITVRDTGGGIEPAVLTRIFEPYFSTKSGGSGLGLAIARNAIEEHGGTIDIDSRPGAGTTVTIDLPAPAGAAVA
jgi:signal transduction histidine kinase